MSKVRRIRKISVFTSGGKFPVLTLSYINTALSQSAFRIYKCYIIIINIPSSLDIYFGNNLIIKSRVLQIKSLTHFQDSFYFIFFEKI